MATLSEHADNIKAAIKAAQDDGLNLGFDITYDAFESNMVSQIELDLWEGRDWINVLTEEWYR